MAIKITPYVGGGVDIFTTKKDNEGAYLGTEETFGFHANNGLLYIEGAAVVSQTRKNIAFVRRRSSAVISVKFQGLCLTESICT